MKGAQTIEEPMDLRRMCVRADGTLRDLLQAIEISGHQICFVVDDASRVIGPVTDGDARRALLGGGDLETTRALDVAHRPFHAVHGLGNHRDQALELMVTYGLQQVPVLDNEGRLTGLHTIEQFVTATPLGCSAVVMAGGQGLRLRPITESIPKPMIRVAGRPILERVVMALVSAGVRKVFLAVNYKKEIIKAHFGDGARHGCEIEYLEEEFPLGTGGPLSLLPTDVDRPVVVLNGDLVGDLLIREVVEEHAASGAHLTMAVGVHSYEVPFGVVDVDDGRVVGLQEKPRQSWWINQGIYVVSPEAISLVPRDVEFPITDLVTTCQARGLLVRAFRADRDWIDVGRPGDLAAAQGPA